MIELLGLGAIARFKTLGRDQSPLVPCMHNGQFDTLDETSLASIVVPLSRQCAGTLRNGALQLQGIALTAGARHHLSPFLNH